MNSGSLKMSVLSWMYDLSIYFKCILILTNILTLFRSCCKGGF